jgi:hypothetical protein
MAMELEAALCLSRDGIGVPFARGRGRAWPATRRLTATLPRGLRSGVEGKEVQQCCVITGVDVD